MTWSNRVIRKTKRLPGKLRTDGKSVLIRFYDVHEVFYNKKGEPDSWTADPIALTGFETLGDLHNSLAQILRDALRFPVLEIKGKKLVERKK